jgi:hypothetical protein
MFFGTTVTSEVYIELFREFVNQLYTQELTLGYYQQDGATSHTSREDISSTSGDNRISYRYDMQM